MEQCTYSRYLHGYISLKSNCSTNPVSMLSLSTPNALSFSSLHHIFDFKKNITLLSTKRTVLPEKFETTALKPCVIYYF